MLLLSGPLCASESRPDTDIVRVLEAQRAPDPGGLIGLPSTLYKGRAAYLHLITRDDRPPSSGPVRMLVQGWSLRHR